MDHITLVGCSTTFSQGVREVVFDVVPKPSFGTFGPINDVSVTATDAAGNVRNWQNQDLNFSSTVASANPPPVAQSMTNRTDWKVDGHRSYLLQVELLSPPTGFSEVEFSINRGGADARGLFSWVDSGVPKYAGEMRLCAGGGNVSIDTQSAGAALVGVQSCVVGAIANGNFVVRIAVRPLSGFGALGDIDFSLRTVTASETSGWGLQDVSAASTVQTATDNSVPDAHIDNPAVDEVVSGQFVAAGWAQDYSGVDSLTFRVDGNAALSSGTWRGIERQDACDARPVLDDAHCPFVGIGASLDVSTVAEGFRYLTVDLTDAKGQSRTLSRRVYVDNIPDSVETVWIQPQSLSGIGPANSLTIAGTASGSAPGSNVLVQFRDLTTGSGWSSSWVAPHSGGSWYTHIPNADTSHAYEVRSSYAVVTAAACVYGGSGGFEWCP